MRVALVTPVFYPYTAGISRVAEHEAKELARVGYNVHVFTPRFKRAHLAIEKKDGYTMHRLWPIFSYGNAAIVPQLKYIVRGFEAIHLHFPFIGGAIWTILGVWFRRLMGRKQNFIITYHMDLVGQGLLKYIFGFLTRLVLPFAVSMADTIRVSSMDYARESRYAKYLFRFPQKLVEIPFGVDIEKFKPQERSLALLQKYNISVDDQVLLFVGALDRAHYFKGLPVLLKALAEYFKDFPVKLIIAGEGDMRLSHEHIVSALKINDQVRFVGFVTAEQLPTLYALSQVVILPSIDSSEAFGMVLVESQACGTPVVASDLPGVRSVFEDGITGVRARPNNVADLARAIKSVINAPNYLEWRARSRERAERLYNSANEVRLLRNILGL